MFAVTLKDGSQVPFMVAQTSLMVLKDLEEIDRVVFSELVQHCRDPQSVELSEATRAKLRGGGVFGGRGEVHGVVRAIIINCVEGDGNNMKLINPSSKI